MKWWQFRRRWRCPHEHVEGIFGDEINYAQARLWCVDCRRRLDGPVTIAYNRQYINEHPIVIYKGKNTDVE